MFKTSVVALALALSFSGQLFAAEEKKSEGQTTLKIEDTQEKNKVKGEDVDEVITNRKMRAEAGSKSRHSVSTSLGYSGGTLEKPLDERRPNITQGSAATAVASLGGGIAYKFSIDPKNAIKVGAGVRWITPLQGKETPKGYKGSKTDVDDPNINYQRVHKIGPIQAVFVSGATLITKNNLRKAGYASSYSLQENMNYELGKSGFSLGLLLSGGYSSFDKTSDALKEDQGDYSMGAYPYLEYVINDTFNLRTISGVWVYEHYRNESSFWTFKKNVIYQSVGVGISLTRDIFLYPNVQFIPEDIRSDRTNVAVSTNINIF